MDKRLLGIVGQSIEKVCLGMYVPAKSLYRCIYLTNGISSVSANNPAFTM